MNESAFIVWFARTALGGGLLLLIGWLGQHWLRQPAKQQRLGEWSLIAALLLAVVALFPKWWNITLPQLGNAMSPKETVAIEGPEPIWDFSPPDQVEPHDSSRPSLVEEAIDRPLARSVAWRPEELLFTIHLIASLVILSYWILARLAVWWILRCRQPIPPHVAELCAEMAYPRRVCLIVSDRVEVPFSVGLFWPTVVLPASLVRTASMLELRWVLAHELTHLARHDTRTCWLFVLGQVVYFYLPWLWWLRRRVRLSQEFVADASAAQWADNPADYAQFLVGWAQARLRAGLFGVAMPATVTGVTGSGSDLFRRVTMLLETKLTSGTRCSRPWILGLAGGLLTLGVVIGGVGVRAVAAEDRKADPGQEAPREEAPKPDGKKDRGRTNRLPLAVPLDLERLLENFGGVGGLDDEEARELQKQMEEVRRQMIEMRKQMMQQMQQGGFGGLGGGFGGGLVLPGDPFGPLAPTMRQPRQPRLGVQVKAPSQTLIDQLELPRDQGVVLEEVGPNSAAGKAGLKSHDIILELDGKPVPSNVEEFVKQLSSIAANKPIEAVVLRKGKKETIKGLTLPEVRAEAPAPRPGVGLGGIGGLGGGVGGFGRGGMTSFNRTNDDFTVKHREGEVTITLSGKVEQGAAKVSEVVIQTGKGQKTTYDSVEKVPAEYRSKVQKLAEMSSRGNLRLPIE